MPLALEHIRRMRGGAQAHLLRCDDGFYYVVKFQNNPQHLRILANEMLGTGLAARLGLPTAPAAVIEVRQDLIGYSADLVIQLGAGSTPCQAGLQFGARYPGDPAQMPVHDFLPDEQLRQVENLSDFAGMLVFDKWTCNTNGRQAIFFLEPGRSRYQTLMIDQGFCFNAGGWDFPDAPLRGLYARLRVYESVRGMKSFEPWVERLDKQINANVLDEVAKKIPPQWYDCDQDALFRLLEQLHRRRKRVREWILAAKNSYRQPFPNWE
jgi:HipA-like protein